MRATSLFLTLLAALAMSAANIEVTTSDYTTKIASAADGDVFVMAAGTYTSQIKIPATANITLRAAEGAEVIFNATLGSDSGAAGGVTFEGIKIQPSNAYFCSLNGSVGNIQTIGFKDCEISPAADGKFNRCLITGGSKSATLGSIVLDGCIVKECGKDGWSFIRPNNVIQSVSVTNSTLYNYAGESFVDPQADNTTDVAFKAVLKNNTFYKWAKMESNRRYAILHLQSKYNNADVTVDVTDNIVWEANGAYLSDKNYLVRFDAASGTVNIKNNVVRNYDVMYGTRAAITIDNIDYTGQLPFTNPAVGDFSVSAKSVFGTGSTTGGAIGDPRWVKDDWVAPTTYVITVATDGEGSRWGKVALLPEAEDNVYVEGTEVTATIVPNNVTTFKQWEDGTTATTRKVTVAADTELTATFDLVPFIVAWTFETANVTRSSYAADLFYRTTNKGMMSIYQGDNSTTAWGGNLNFAMGGVRYNAIRRYTNLADMAKPRSFVAKLSGKGYKNIRVHSKVGFNNNCVHTTQLLQYATDGADNAATWTTLKTLEFSASNKNQWLDLDADLPAELQNAKAIYLRWIGDATTALVDPATTDSSEGFYLADVTIYADEDPTAAGSDDAATPAIVATSPADGSVYAQPQGELLLRLNKPMTLGTGSITLNGVELTPALRHLGRTVALPYSGLSYGTEYTLTVPAGYLVDSKGNALTETSFSFTTMTRTAAPKARTYDAIVDATGSVPAGFAGGVYTTVQAAIDAAPTGRTEPYLIFVKNGEYEELVTIPATKPYIHLIGQDKDKTVIKYGIVSVDDPGKGLSDAEAEAARKADQSWPYNPKNPNWVGAAKYGTSSDISSVVVVDADNFYSENITYYNTFGVEFQAGPQALAMKNGGDRAAFNNCAFRSFQDTWLTSTTVNYRHYATNCWIEGAVDYLYGAAEAFIENSTFWNCREGSVIVAPNHLAQSQHGFAMVDCTVVGDKENNLSLGRPWHNSPKTVWLNLTAQCDIRADGWTDMGAVPGIFAEYNTIDRNGEAVDMNNRKEVYMVGGTAYKVDYNPELTATEAAEYTYEKMVPVQYDVYNTYGTKQRDGSTDGWNPRQFFEPTAAAANFVYSAKDGLSWDAVPYAIGYLVMDSEGSVIANVGEPRFAGAAKDKTYRIQSVNEFGSLGDTAEVEVNEDITTGVSDATRLMDKGQWIEHNAVYNLNGQRVGANYRGLVIQRGRVAVAR